MNPFVVAPSGADLENARAPEGATTNNFEDGKSAAEVDRALAPQIDPRDTMVISGFWRSGTTWLEEALTEILQAKTIFEPFHFLVPSAKKLFKYYGIAKKPEPFRELFMPFCGDRTLEWQPLLHQYYDRALRADLPGDAVRVLRQDAEECYRTRVVVKFTRGQLSLRAAQNTFGMPIIHVYRDPRAVIASAKMTDWYWLFDHLRLQEQLLDIKDGRANFFGQWAEAIAEYDNDKVTRIAAYWSLTERFLQETFADGRGRIAFVSYEELSRGKEEFMLALLVQLGVKKVWRDEVQLTNRDSYSTSQQRQGASTAERIAGWKKALTSAEIATIEAVVTRFGLAKRMA